MDDPVCSRFDTPAEVSDKIMASWMTQLSRDMEELRLK